MKTLINKKVGSRFYLYQLKSFELALNEIHLNYSQKIMKDYEKYSNHLHFILQSNLI